MTRPLPSCLKCGLPISFRKNSRGAFVPTNPDGSDHWDACREAINSSVAHRRVVEKIGSEPSARLPTTGQGQVRITSLLAWKRVAELPDLS